MAKIIKMTPEIIDEVRRDFENAISSMKLSDGKISFTKSFTSIQRKATVYFTEIAWLKMQSLIREFDKEVAWHGLAFRGEDPEKDEYTITDILVYPQEVTGATVTSDQTKYQEWLMSHDDDVFNNIRMQGHSHVNMATNPSSVDLSLYERILDQLDDSMFYIFLIYNKRGEKTYKIYDMAKNILFETGDVTVKIVDDGSGLTKFLEDAKSKVKDHVYQPAYGGQASQYGYRQNNYSSSQYGGYQHGSYGGASTPAASKPASTPAAPKTAPAAPVASTTKTPEQDESKKKIFLRANPGRNPAASEKGGAVVKPTAKAAQ